MTLWINVEDLFAYASRHRRLSGVQRLTMELICALRALPGVQVGFVRHDLSLGEMWVVDWPVLRAQFEALNGAAASRTEQDWTVVTKSAPGRGGAMLPPAVGEPLAKAARAQARVPALLGQAAKGLLAARRRSAEPVVAGPLLHERAQPGDALCFFGIPGGDTRLFDMIEEVVDAVGVELAVLVHDIIRLRRPEFSNPMPGSSASCAGRSQADQVLTVSRATATAVALGPAAGVDVEAPAPAHPSGHGLRRGPPALAAPGAGARPLCAVRVHDRAAQESRPGPAGLAPAVGHPAAGAVPKLVFAGRVGWMAGDLMAPWTPASGWTDAMSCASPGNGALAALYKGAAFTLFLSHDEGWGLPVSESLAFGRTSVASCAPSVMEAGGDFCFYVDPDDTSGACPR